MALLLLNKCLLLLSLFVRGYCLFGPCFVMQYLVSSDRAGFCVSSRGTVSWFVVSEFVISWSYSLVFYKNNDVARTLKKLRTSNGGYCIYSYVPFQN